MFIFADLEDHLKSIRKTAMEIMPGSSSSLMDSTRGKPPGQADIVIIGGGVVGWSIAYWIKRRESDRGGLKVVVVEKDPTYSQASTVLSCGGIRQQFSLKENILLSMESADFLRNINDHLWVRNEEPIDLQFNHSGYLFLANEQCAPVMEDNFKIQR
ncbi:hypothetical protein DNTS_034636 [Danionella cerebrum]|uniref:FAD-dependent oxidoreductase domain-containing protein 1 n=1 Tax=Danionella cerebrum TaxID=2873325 RepID=A0A553QKX0_9TELE|nr:hypothetical protein DNTS_034636 [Danionella translucida]